MHQFHDKWDFLRKSPFFVGRSSRGQSVGKRKSLLSSTNSTLKITLESFFKRVRVFFFCCFWFRLSLCAHYFLFPSNDVISSIMTYSGFCFPLCKIRSFFNGSRSRCNSFTTMLPWRHRWCSECQFNHGSFFSSWIDPGKPPSPKLDSVVCILTKLLLGYCDYKNWTIWLCLLLKQIRERACKNPR